MNDETQNPNPATPVPDPSVPVEPAVDQPMGETPATPVTPEEEAA